MAYHFGVPGATGTALVPLVPLPLPFFLLGQAKRSGAERSGAERSAAERSAAKWGEVGRAGARHGRGTGRTGVGPGCHYHPFIYQCLYHHGTTGATMAHGIWLER